MNPLGWIKTLLRRFWPENLTNSEPTPVFSQTREVFTPKTRDIENTRNAENAKTNEKPASNAPEISRGI